MDKINVLITGASRGIGREIALTLAKEGYNIAFTYKNSEKQAMELAKEIESYGVEQLALKADVSDKNAVENFWQRYSDKFSSISVLINNAGIKHDKSLAFMSDFEWDEVINTNLTGLFNITRPVIYKMIKQKYGHIINMASVSGIVGIAGQTNYSAAKAGIIGFTKALAKEAAQYGIRVNAIAPGFIESDMTNSFSEKGRERLLKTIPLKRFGSPQEVGDLIRYLVTGGDAYITGQVFCIDGGLSNNI